MNETSLVLAEAGAPRVEVVEGELRVRDLDLAEVLGMKAPYAIRRIIEKHLPGEVLDRGSKTSPLGGRPGREFWLTEEQALIVVTKSDTPRAAEITRTIVRVFRAAVRGELAPARSETRLVLEAVREITAQLATLRRDVDGMRALATGTTDSPHAIGERAGRRILGRILALAREVADLMGEPTPAVVASVRASIDTELRSRLGYSGRRRSWARLPAGQHAQADLFLEEIVARERERARFYQRRLSLPESRQGELFR